MDNNDALIVIRNYNVGTPGAVYDRTSQIDILVHDGHTMAYVFPPRNHIARFLAMLAMNTCDYLYTMDHPIGRVEELHGYFPSQCSPRPCEFQYRCWLRGLMNELGLGWLKTPPDC